MARSILFQIAKVQMIELRERLSLADCLGHVRGDFLAAGVIVDMSVGIDDLHAIIPPRVIGVRHCFRWPVVSGERSE